MKRDFTSSIHRIVHALTNPTGKCKHILVINLPVVVQQCGVCGRCIVDELCTGTVFGRFVMEHR